MEAHRRRTGTGTKRLSAAALLLCAALFLSSCIPTYPKEKLPETVKEVCRIEYGMDVEVSVKGSTIGIYYPMEGLLDATFSISKESWDKISNLILVASRVVLSTDADIKFYCVITKDARLPEIQVIIIKYVDDIKRGMYRNISRNESFKRTLFSINLTPQAKKERSIEKIFDKLGLEDESREDILNEFFRTPPTKLSDIGYWREQFYLKEIKLEEFLASQIANRIKIDFRQDEELSVLYKYASAEGFFISGKDARSFLLKFKIFEQAASAERTEKAGVVEAASPAPDAPSPAEAPPADKEDAEAIEAAGAAKAARNAGLRVRKLEEIVRIVNEVMRGYKFKNFDFIELEDQLQNTRLWINSDDIYNFHEKKLSIGEIIKTL